MFGKVIGCVAGLVALAAGVAFVAFLAASSCSNTVARARSMGASTRAGISISRLRRS